LTGDPAPANNLYIIISPTARTLPTWPPKGYAGPSGRLDVIARSFLALQSGSEAYAILLGPPDPPKTIYYNPSSCTLKSERQAMMEIARALLGRGRCVSLVDKMPERILYEAAKERGLTLLEEEGRSGGPRPGSAYLLGAHVDPPEDIMRVARRLAVERLSIGPYSYHTSHVIAYIEWSTRVCG